jgi:hypothetical protein
MDSFNASAAVGPVFGQLVARPLRFFAVPLILPDAASASYASKTREATELGVKVPSSPSVIPWKVDRIYSASLRLMPYK